MTGELSPASVYVSTWRKIAIVEIAIVNSGCGGARLEK